MTLSLWTDPASSKDIYVHILAGQSNAHGLWGTPLVPKSLDKRVLFWPEVGLAYDPAGEDYTRDEAPPGTPSDAPRWEQTVDRTPMTLGPVVDPTFGLRWGPDISIGRLAINRMRAQRTLGDVAVVKFTYSGSSLNHHWMRKDRVNLTERFFTFLREVKAKITAGGNRVRWASFTWIQGESDCLDDEDARLYKFNLPALIRRLRLNTVANLPVVIARTDLDIDLYEPASERPAMTKRLRMVTEAQAATVKTMQPAALISLDGLNHIDWAHFEQDEYLVIGNRAYLAWERLMENEQVG